MRPEERGIARAARHGVDSVQAGAGVDDGVAGGQLHALLAECVFHDQLAAFVFVGIAEEHRGGDIGSDLDGRARNGEEGVVDMVAIGTSALIAIEARWQDLERQGCRHEQRVAAQPVQDQIAYLLAGLAVQRQLQIALDLRGHMTGRGLAVLPAGGFQRLTAVAYFIGSEQAGDA
ncbi:hypothetical protein SDC9_189050 [bioreactor metagenome]|uniref:Uncharacterized protein n=1 Tax=bioreactor metagenome TaxID=1076179 RepID=A0A645HR19_9ZZZZ